jgi:hypothetical protein
MKCGYMFLLNRISEKDLSEIKSLTKKNGKSLQLVKKPKLNMCYFTKQEDVDLWLNQQKNKKSISTMRGKNKYVTVRYIYVHFQESIVVAEGLMDKKEICFILSNNLKNIQFPQIQKMIKEGLFSKKIYLKKSLVVKAIPYVITNNNRILYYPS